MTKAPNGYCRLYICESGADPGEGGCVAGSEAGRWRGGPGVSLPAGPVFGQCPIKGRSSEAALAKPPFPPTLLIRMKPGRRAPEGAALSPMPR